MLLITAAADIVRCDRLWRTRKLPLDLENAGFDIKGYRAKARSISVQLKPLSDNKAHQEDCMVCGQGVEQN